MLDMQVSAMRRIAVDFDGTLVEEKWPEMGAWLPGAVDALKQLAELFDEVVIFSCRLAKMDTDESTPRDNYDQIVEMNKMLEKAGIPHNVILWTKDYKPPAEFYIDDKAIRFTGDWEWIPRAVVGLSRHSMPLTNSDPGDEQADELDWHSALDDFFDWEGNYKPIRTFETGATRDTDDGKLDYEGFLSPRVLEAYARYMHRHRIQSDGSLRASDNWQKGIPYDAYMKSLWRHFMEVWTHHRAGRLNEMALEEALCAVLFNTSGYLHELLVD